MVRTYSSTATGPSGVLVEIEASVQSGLPAVVITGLPGDIVKESRERIRACIAGLGFQIPSAKSTVHLSPAAAKKQGSQLDVGIALALLDSEKAISLPSPLNRIGFLGELSLDGRIRGVQNALVLAEAILKGEQVDHLFIPESNAEEVALLGKENITPVASLPELIRLLGSQNPLPSFQPVFSFPEARPSVENETGPLDAVLGQPIAKRALEVALAGEHHLLLVGPPGVGKSLLASAAPSLLPPLSRPELIQLVRNQGYVDFSDSLLGTRPFRSPHHSISSAALLGGGSGTVLGGEVSLAHAGVLFLDELPEFRKDALEGLREPLQSGEIHLHRVGTSLRLPARFVLIAAMNPCPCGYAFQAHKRCVCPPQKAFAYRKRVSGPLFDRMDLCVVLNPSSEYETKSEVTHSKVRESIARVRTVQAQRNPTQDLRASLGEEAQSWIRSLQKREFPSYRSIDKTLRVARTVADLEGESEISIDHLREAWSLRCRDFSKV
jgi:magnesium chelatase family protein